MIGKSLGVLGYDIVEYLFLYIDRMEVLLPVFIRTQKDVENTIQRKK